MIEKIKPVLIYQSYKGSISHLSVENQSFFCLGWLGLSLSDTYPFKAAFEAFPANMTSHKYFNQKTTTEFIITPLDQRKVLIKGMSTKDSIKIEIHNNRTTMTNKQYLELIRQINPKAIVTLTEIPQNVMR